MLNLKQLAYITEKNQSELGHILGVPQSAVSYMMNGFRRIRPEHIKRLKEAFGDSVVESCMESDERIDAHAGAQTVQATILHRDIVEEVREELREEMAHPKREELREEMAYPKREDVEVIDAEEVELKVTPILTPDIVNQPGLDIKRGLEAGTLPVQFKPTQDIVPDGVVKVYLENDEMAPDIEANDPVLIRLMDDKNAIVHGRMYFVDLNRGAVVRWVFPQNDGTLLLKSKNAPDMIVQPESVKSISEVVTIWKRPKCLPPDHVSMFEELRRRDDQMDELLAQQGRLIGIIEKHN